MYKSTIIAIRFTIESSLNIFIGNNIWIYIHKLCLYNCLSIPIRNELHDYFNHIIQCYFGNVDSILKYDDYIDYSFSNDKLSNIKFNILCCHYNIFHLDNPGSYDKYHNFIFKIHWVYNLLNDCIYKRIIFKENTLEFQTLSNEIKHYSIILSDRGFNPNGFFKNYKFSHNILHILLLFLIEISFFLSLLLFQIPQIILYICFPSSQMFFL